MDATDAKFNHAQTTSLGAALGATALGVLWWPGARWSVPRLQLATGAASLYWVTQVSASAYPGTTMLDDPVRRFGPQTVVGSVAVGLNAAAYVLGRRSLRA